MRDHRRHDRDPSGPRPYGPEVDFGHPPSERSGAISTGTVMLAAGALGILAATMLTRPRRPVPPEDAPAWTLRRPPRGARGGHTLVGRTVTINRPRAELYAFWRDFSNLPRFMEDVLAVTMLPDGRSRWTIAAPAGRTVTFDTEVTEERPGELIAWQSVEDAPVRNSGRIRFRDAPGGRGTEVEATIAYAPPGGAFGRTVARIFQHEPSIQARRELKRFKQLMETGEIANAAPAPNA